MESAARAILLRGLQELLAQLEENEDSQKIPEFLREQFTENTGEAESV